MLSPLASDELGVTQPSLIHIDDSLLSFHRLQQLHPEPLP
jgi:hypothetical protein